MSQKKRPSKPISGGARLVQSGKHPVLLGLTPEQRDIIGRAAKEDGRPLTQFFIHHGLAAAKRILRNMDARS